MASFNSTLMITDPDLLFYSAGTSGTAPAGANLIIDYTTMTPSGGKIMLRAVSGLAADGGVTLKCLYSKLKEIWKSDAILIKFPFPMLPITDEQFEIINGWDFADLTTKQLVRTGGWALKSADGAVTLEEFAGIITLGSLSSTAHPIYYSQSPLTSTAATGVTSEFALTGPVNQAVKIFGNAAYGNVNYRGYLKLFVREYGSLYSDSTSNDIGVATLTYQCYRFPVTTSTDLKAINTNPTTGVYANMKLKWESSPIAQTATSAANYNVTIEASGGTAQQVYEYVQYQMRHNNTTDIDTNVGATYIKNGEVTPLLLKFVGDTLYVIYQSTGATGGVWVNNISAVDKNSIYFYDNLNVQHFYPYQAVLRINFGDNLITDTTSKFTVFFTTNPLGNYGASGAVIVNDAVPLAMNYAVSAISNVVTNKYADLTFDYDGNTQGGRVAGTDANVTVVALGLSTAQYVKTTGTIAKSKANSVSLVSNLERNYLNP